MPFKRLSSRGAVLIAVSARVSLLYGAPARPFLARSLRCSNFLFRCAVRVRATRFRQWRSEGICAREIVRGKANRNDPETEEEPLMSGLWRGLKVAPQCLYQKSGEAVSRTSIAKGARNSFAFSICKTGRA